MSFLATLRHRRGSLYTLGTWGHLPASCRSLPESRLYHAHVCCVSLTPWLHQNCRFINFPLLLLHLHTSPFVLVANCLFSSNATTGGHDQIHCRHPDYVRSTFARNSYPTCFRRLPTGTPLARFTLQNQLLATSIRAYFHRCVPTALFKCMLLLP